MAILHKNIAQYCDNRPTFA